MQKLENRIAALELTMPRKGGITAIWTTILNPDFSQPDVDRMTDHAGGMWLRLPGETAQELQDRAIAAARLTTKGMPRLIADECLVEH